MTLIAINGFDSGHAGTFSGGGISTSGRNSGRCMSTGASNVAASFTRTGSTESIIFGFAINVGAFVSNQNFVYIQEGAVANYLSLELTTGGGINVVNDNDTNFGTPIINHGTTDSVLTVSTWHYIEIEWYPHDTTGIIKLRVDGETPGGWTDISGDTTVATPTADTFTITFHDQSGAVNLVDDFYCLDTAGSAPLNDFLGTVRVPYSPVDSQTSAAFVGSDSNSVDNHLLLDEIPVSQTDYVESATATDRDVYGVTALGLTGTPLAVQPVLYAEDSDAGSQALEIGVISTTSAEESSTPNLGSLNQVRGPLVLDDPDGGGALTTTIVDAMELFFEVA